MAKIIGIADCNNFYVSCERVFNPSLNKKPVLVLTNNDGSAIARSQEAKDLGIKKGQKIYDIKELIEEKKIDKTVKNANIKSRTTKKPDGTVVIEKEVIKTETKQEFKRIREELSLVYFIGSVYDQNKGSFVIYGGINQKDYHNVQKEVENILLDVKNMTYENKFLVIAKKAIVSGLVQSLDSGGALISRLNSLSLFNKEFDIDVLVDKVTEKSKVAIGKISKSKD